MAKRNTHLLPFREFIGNILCLDCTKTLMIFASAGLLVLTFDSFLEHYFTQRSMKSYQWIPVVFGALATPICFVVALGMRLRPWSARLFGGASLVSIVVGGLGFYFHMYAILRTLEFPLSWQDVSTALRFGPPALAPLAFAGVGTLGMIAVFGPADLLNFLFEKLYGTSLLSSRESNCSGPITSDDGPDNVTDLDPH